jgi:hypothetical protein
MAITKGDQITYSDLILDVYNKIISNCKNIDHFDSDVPVYMRNSTTGDDVYDFTIKSAVLSKNTLSAMGKVKDSAMVVVPSSKVRQQLEEFLKNRGIASKGPLFSTNENGEVVTTPGETITFKGMMNFYNNIASFLSKRLIVVGNSFNTTTCLFYNHLSTDEIGAYPTVSALNQGIGENENLDFTSDQIETSMSQMLNAINSTSKIWYPKTDIKYTCSSSSSSSSSSSCSSSSSMFIAYMEI